MKLSCRFRPKVDARVLTDFNQLAWQAKSDTIMNRVKGQIAEVLSEFLNSQYPAVDMALLRRYGCTTDRKEVYVRVRMPDSEQWTESVCIPLPDPLEVASSYSGLYCGGPRYSEEPDGGLKPDTIAEIKAGQNDTFADWDAYLKYHRQYERTRVPKELEPLFFEIVAAQQAYKREYRQIHDWPKGRKQATGQYPTWEEIAAEFPVAGEEIRKAAAQ